MPRGMYKSRTMRRVFVKVPGNTTKLHYRRKKPSKAICAECGKVLSGVPRENPRTMHKLPRSSKRPQRPYGGVLCSACTRRKLKNIVRA